jgi:hypothetical protein
MRIFDLPSELKRRNSLLYNVGLAHAIFFALFFILYFVDDRQVMNINPWIKPMKFALSITLYLWTFAWLLYYIPDPRHVRRIGIVIVVSMIAEMATIALQAARGVPSHFNVTSVFNGLIFSVMGLFIALNTLVNLMTFILFFSPKIQMETSVKMAWQFGLLLLVLGSISGGLMVVRLAHTVGAPDGGPGLPFVNWSTIAGDIRVAHFFTLHGLQLIPLIWWVISIQWKLTQKTSVLILISAVYLGLCVWLHVMALGGHSVLGS